VVFNATFNNMLYHGDQFSWWRRPEQPEKTTDLLQVIDKLSLSHNVVSSTLHLNRIRTHNFGDDRH
jgi:hypothetical protein